MSDEVPQIDDEFLEHISLRTLSVKNEFARESKFNTDDFVVLLNKQANTKEIRSSFPLPYIKTKVVDSMVRSTMDDLDKIEIICGKMIQSQNTILVTLAEHCSNHIKTLEKVTNDSLLFTVKFSKDQEREIGLEGPGRKKFEKKGSEEHRDKSKEKTGKSMFFETDVSIVETTSLLMSQKEKIPGFGSMERDMTRLSELSGLGLDYVKLCQSIFREININSMRGDRRKKYVVKPTGVDGVFVCLYKGTKLRCGELANIVWFKVIVDNDFIIEDSLSYNPLFKRLFRDLKVSHSNWLSCDVHRLDHYIRCYDKILMSYTSVMSQTYKDKQMDETTPRENTLLNLIDKDDSNTLGLIIMIYMEDRRVTSKMLQHVRYLIMTSISIWPKFSQVMDKMIEPIRSPIQLYFIKKCLVYIDRISRWDITSFLKFGKVRYDHSTHTFLDSLGGATIRMPRPLTIGSNDHIEFSQVLCEMYFTMLFNKNQDDPTHSSFQILDKIIEGEESYNKSKSEELHYGYSDMNDQDFADMIIDKEQSHTFSRKAIEIGAMLLRLELDDVGKVQISDAVSRMNVNKTLDEFATYKSSASSKEEYYDPMKKKQNSRDKCITNCLKLLDMGLYRTFDVVEKFKNEETYFHIFKKKSNRWCSRNSNFTHH